MIFTLLYYQRLTKNLRNNWFLVYVSNQRTEKVLCDSTLRINKSKNLVLWFRLMNQKLLSQLFGSRQRFITRISWIIFQNRYNKWIKWFETVVSLPSSDSKSTVNSEIFPLVPIYNDNCSASSDSASTSAVLHFWTDWILRWNLRRAIRSRVNSLSAFLFCWLNSIFQCFCCTGFKIYRKF